MSNRLADATSPYLLQHKDNPVHWWPWSDEAFAEAAQRDVPVLLSIGYAACHWCHVMAHESFEDPATAALMNEHFVNIKVDREERPDVDAVYMAATQSLIGHGGWPMTVFLTPAGRPFYAGTYFPPTARHQMPAFTEVLGAIQQTWTTRRSEVDDASLRISEVVARQAIPSVSGVPDAPLLERAARSLLGSEDHVDGGFGGAPKFPPSMDLEFLLRHAARRRLERAARPGDEAAEAGGGLTVEDDDSGDLALAAAGRTLRTMAGSGLYDQLAGGFARYAVDAAWVVPHFEKMLYDNALLARVYLHWWRLTGEPTGARIALETCDWMLAALRTPEGGLASSLDADTPIRGADGALHGVEGYTYVWTPGQLRDVLGADDAAWAAGLLRVTEHGTFERGASTLQLDHDVWAEPGGGGPVDGAARDAAGGAGSPPPTGAGRQGGRGLERPGHRGAGRDGRVAGPARSGRRRRGRGRPAAGGAPGGHAGARAPRRVSRDGVAGEPVGVLEDYADLAEGLLALHAVTGEQTWLQVAGLLLDTVLDHFADPGGGFFDTPDDAADAALAAVRRPQDPTDNAYPSGWNAAAGALLSYAALTGSERHREAAERGLGVVAGSGASAPRAFGWGLAVAEALLDGPREVAVVGPDGDPARLVLHRMALAGTAPGLVVACGHPDAEGEPLLAGRPLPDDAAAAYVCRHFACDAPTSDPATLARTLGARHP